MADLSSDVRSGVDAFSDLEVKARAAGAAIASALTVGQLEAQKLDDVLRTVGVRLADMTLQTAGRALGGLAANGLNSGLSALFSAGADGFGAGASAGGEALGRALSVVMNVQTSDADSFRRSESQLSSALARLVQRGDRSL